jgi:hypothetical protein
MQYDSIDLDKFHPWEEFLKARYAAILWLKEKEVSNDDIAIRLSMDSGEHVSAIITAMQDNKR